MLLNHSVFEFDVICVYVVRIVVWLCATYDVDHGFLFFDSLIILFLSSFMLCLKLGQGPGRLDDKLLN